MKGLFYLSILALFASCVVKIKSEVKTIRSGVYEFYYSDDLSICAGVDSLFPSGKGIYLSEDSCVFFKEKFAWSAENKMLYMHYTESQFKDKCAKEYENTGAYTQHWKVFKIDGNDFYATMELQIIDNKVEYQPEFSEFYILRKVADLD